MSAAARTVRDATFDVMRRHGLTTIFANPGSTEVAFLVDLPDDLDFVLALHEASVVGIATGYALATGRPALALLHTTAGLGNAVGAIATARVNRAPLVVLVGQQDRRHLAFEPFLAGRLTGLAGDYPLDVSLPVRAADVPATLARAAYAAQQGQGPVLVIVPMDDWDAPADDDAYAAPARLVTGIRDGGAAVGELVRLLASSRTPAVVAGAGMDTAAGWAAVRGLAERLGTPVWTEPFGARAGFDQTHPLYAGHLPADRTRLRAALATTDLLLVAGTGMLRQYPFRDGPLVPAGTRVAVVTADPAEGHRSSADLVVVADPAVVLDAVAAQLDQRPQPVLGSTVLGGIPVPDPGLRGDRLSTAAVFAVLARHLPADAVLVEEAPSARPALQALVPARRPLGFLSAAMGGLGFAMPAAVGIRMGQPGWPVVAVVGDGSSLYAIQSLWTAAHRQVGVLFLVLANGGYVVMDRLAEQRGGKPPWPPFPEVSVSALARGFGVAATQVADRDRLEELLGQVCPGLGARTEPLVIEVAVAPETTFAP